MAQRGVIFKDDFVSTPGRSWFDMSYDYLFSMNFGELVPSTMMECMAEDTIHAKSDSFTRLAPLVSPTFGKCNLFSYHFYVRNRSIWKQWEEFFADNDQMESWQQANPSWTPPEMPQISPLKVLDALSDGFWRSLDGYDPTFATFLNTAYFTRYSTYLELYGMTNVQLLVISATSGGQVSIHATENIPKSALSTYSYTGGNVDAESIFIAYVPNKYDPQLRQDFDSIDAEVSDAKEYNVFSNGSLFDFLGVDLCGHYAEQYTTFVRELTTIRTALSDSDYKLGVDADGNIYCDDAYLMNIKKFLSSHKVLCYGYNHNEQLVSVNARTGAYTLIGEEDHAADIAALTPVVNYDYSSVISTLPLRAYWQVYIDYFRDQNYISVNKNIDWTRNGEDVDWTQSYDTIFDFFTLQRKAYEHDPYTTALPGPQRGNAVRFLNDASIKYGESTTLTSGSSTRTLVMTDQGLLASSTSGTAGSTTTNPRVIVDLSAATIENFRFANALQKLSEKIARSGGRYYEYMRAVYGADIQDAKIDRAIFLGGDKTPIQISEVLQTSASQVTDDQPLGQMAGRGISIGNDDKIEYITPDAGFFVEIVCALPRTNYQQGIAPMFGRLVRLDFAVPDFAQLGEQQVPQKELWYTARESEDEKPFGYQSRYYDYKYQRDRTSGSFKDNMSYWTWSRIFEEAPLAGKEFLEVRPDYRQFAVVDKNVEHIYCHMFHDIQVNRALPVFGIPSL